MAVKRLAPDAANYLEDDDDTIDVPARTPAARAAVVVETEDPTEQAPASNSIQAGWASAKKALADSRSTAYTKDLTLTDEPQVIKFLSAEPIAVFKQHWLSRDGKKSFVCLGARCPLCDRLGDSPSQKFTFSVANLSLQEGMDRQVWTVGPRLAEQLHQHNGDPRSGPLDKAFYAVSRTGTGTKTQHMITPVKERDLADDYGLDPEVVGEFLSTADVHDEKAIQTQTYAELLEIAKEIA